MQVILCVASDNCYDNSSSGAALHEGDRLGGDDPLPFAAVARMIMVSCEIGTYAIQNAMFDIWLMLGFGVVGYVFKKTGIPLAPFALAFVLGNRAEDAFRLSMIGAGGDPKVFWSNRLVGSITTLVIVLLFGL